MDGTGIVGRGSKESFVDKAAAMPGISLRQRDGAADKAAEGTRLWQRLAVELVNPLWRTVGTDNDEGLMLIPGLCDGGSQVEQCRATGDADNDGGVKGLHHAKGIETCRTLVGDGVALDVGTLVQIMDDGGIATARTNHSMTNAVGLEQGRQYVYILFVTKHLRMVSSLASVSCHSCSKVLSRSKPPPAYK